jgi:hypothetical protein
VAHIQPATPVLPVDQTVHLVKATSPAAQPVGDRELPPGKTVTVIPTSSGPSVAAEPGDEFPSIRTGTLGGHGGGRCPPRGRGPGIGIAGAPRPDFR